MSIKDNFTKLRSICTLNVLGIVLVIILSRLFSITLSVYCKFQATVTP